MARDDHEPRMVALSADEVAAESRPGREGLGEFKLGPRNGAQLVDLGIEVLASRFLSCVGLAVLLWLPVRALMPFVVRMIPQTAFNSEETTEFWLALGGIGIIATFLEVMLTMTLTLISYEALIGGVLSPTEAIMGTLKRSLGLLGFFFLRFLIISVGGMVTVFIGVMCFPLLLGALAYWLYFSWKLSIAPCILMLEGLGVGASISRSFKLTEGSFLRWLALFSISFLLTSWFASVQQLSDNLTLRQEFLEATSVSPLLFDGILVVITSFFTGITTAVFAVVSTSFYLDTRIRREGLDLSMRLERIARAHRAEPAT